jgi:poly(3-hydroxybutyrate) depolymerase/peroxiredoxin
MSNSAGSRSEHALVRAFATNRVAARLLALTALLGPFGSISLRAEPPSPPPASGPLEGTWRCVVIESDGIATSGWRVEAARMTFTFAGDSVSAPSLWDEGRFTLPSFPRDAIDLRVAGEEMKVELPGLYAIQGDRLTLCIPFEPAEGSDRPVRPSAPATRAGDGRMMFQLERVPPGRERRETPAEQWGAIAKQGLAQKLAPAEWETLAARCVKIAESARGTDAATVSLLWATANAPGGPSAARARSLLKEGAIAGANIDTLAECLGVRCGTIGPGGIPTRLRIEWAPLLLERVRRTPDHPQAAELLCEVCVAADEAVEPPAAFDEAARIIGARWTKSPDLSHFLERLAYHKQLPWTGRYESIVRQIARESPSHYVRYRAAYTLAQLVAEGGEARQEEARELLVRFVADCQPEQVDPSVRGLVEEFVDQARRELDAMLIRGIGGPAPELKGVDLDGRPISSAGDRGRVMLISFWATWCGPCMSLIPHERTLVERFRDRPFVLLGVNGDDSDPPAGATLAKLGITWRSIRNKLPSGKTISDEWHLAGWPTLYLVDHTGKIRRRWTGVPPTDEFDHEIERWVAVAEGKPLAAPLRLRAEPISQAAAGGVPARFVDKVYVDSAGKESKYVVCLPQNDDGRASLPVVVFLHGSGQIGTDNREQLDIGLGPALRKRGLPFPAIFVFPQSQHGSWLAESPDGRRASAILASVEKEYRTDPRRVYLTGVSMGAEGVWSLAAADPRRFAAIVPVCGGGEPSLAGALTNVPCWAFHGDADPIVPVQATREMIAAITKAGGRPLYQEYRGVDHACWDRVYADAELYRWLQSQASPAK